MKYRVPVNHIQFSLTVVAFVFALVVNGYATGNIEQTDLGTQYDSRRRVIKERIARTTPEGLQTLKTVRGMKIEVNEKRSAKTLGEIVEDFEQGKGFFKLRAVGWEAVKKITGSWKIVFYYQREGSEYVDGAEWEYNPETNNLYIFEIQNSPWFWTKNGRYRAATPK